MAATPFKKSAPIDIGDSELEARIAQDLEAAKSRNRRLRALESKSHQARQNTGLVPKTLNGLATPSGQSASSAPGTDSNPDDDDYQARLLQQQQQQAALERQKNNSLSDSLRNRIASKLGGQNRVGTKAAMQASTAKMLSYAWEIVVESFGMSIVVVDIVVLLRLVFGDSICRLGHEWVPEQVKKISPAKAEAMGERMAIVEKIGCACINGCCGLVALVAIVIISLIVQVVSNPLGTFFSMFTSIFSN